MFSFVSGVKMALSQIHMRLAACLLNISEGRKKDIVERVAKAAVYHNNGKLNFSEQAQPFKAKHL